MVNRIILQEKIYGGTVESRLAFGLLLFRKLGKLLAEISDIYIALGEDSLLIIDKGNKKIPQDL